MYAKVGRELTCRVDVEVLCAVVGPTHAFLPKELF